MSLAGRASSTRACRLLAAVCCVPALALAACSQDEPDPIVGDEGSPSASASPSPSDSPSTQPWEKRTKAGAVAFVKHWVDVFNEAGANGDTSELREISAAGCKACTGYADMIDELYEEGGQLRSRGWTVREAGIADGVPVERALVGTRIERSREVIISGTGDRQRFPGGSANYSASTRWRQGWVMAKFVNVS